MLAWKNKEVSINIYNILYKTFLNDLFSHYPLQSKNSMCGFLVWNIWHAILEKYLSYCWQTREEFQLPFGVHRRKLDKC